MTFLPMENIGKDGSVDMSIRQKISSTQTGFTPFAKNDVIIAKITPCFENGKGACLDQLDTVIGFGTTELIVLRAYAEKLLPRFLYYITMLTVFRKKGAEVMTGSAGQKRVPVDYIANFIVGLPDINGQREIVDFLDKNSKIFNLMQLQLESELKNILEYKNTLIAAIVTGQVDVRNIAVEAVSAEDLTPSDDPDESEEQDSLMPEESEE